MARLTVAKVRTLTRPGRYGDGGTLFLVVAPKGSKAWIQRLTIRGRRHDLGLGGFPLTSLAEARDLAFDNRRLARRGGDPLAQKRKAAVPTFREASAKALEANRATRRHTKTAALWAASMEKHCFSIFGDRPVDEVDRADVLRVLSPIWTAKPELARKVRQRIKATFAWAEAHGFCDRNPAGAAIDGALPAQPSVKAHFRALAYTEVAAALDTIEASRAALAVKACLRFVVLTACRSGEARLAAWTEIDVEAREWRVPGSRMKGGVEHRVPLSDATLAALESMRPLRDSSGLVFPSPVKPGAPLSNTSMTMALRRAGLADRCTIHGFRSSFRTWASEKTAVPHAVAEAALAHAVGSSVERSYARSDLFDKRRGLMDDWARFLTGAAAAKVVRLA